ncbi:MAG TPA: hypothetical protein VFO41_08050 [Alphaproteobacteria bacterium]|nr:hypothetical protein [Alphaproteobacteria bacterium]
MNSHTLVSHRDIQSWISNRRGMPAMRRVPNRFGEIKARLTISFPRHQVMTETPSLDDGLSPCSWTAWLAELDRQELALRVDEGSPSGFEFVARRDFN